ncbi:MAG: hypothetical protein ACR2IK_20420 [Chloroflexota bacterium]
MESNNFAIGDVDEFVTALEAQFSDGAQLTDPEISSGTCAYTCTGGC